MTRHILMLIVTGLLGLGIAPLAGAAVKPDREGFSPGNHVARPSDPYGAETRPLPRVLMLGDSISMGYHEFVVANLADEAIVVRPRENCAGTTKGIEKIDEWLRIDGGGFDVIHFNFGLHDLKRVTSSGRNSNDPSDPHQADLETYERNLRQIVAALKKTDATLVFATTTPVPPGGVRPHRDPEDVVRYNHAAKRIMKEHGIAIDDLYSFALPRMAEIQPRVDVHFTKDGSQQLGDEVTRQLRKTIAGEPIATRPNILFIIVDDQSPFDLRVYNPKSALETPVIDRLAAEGMTIDGAYHMGSWSGAVCTPSRHMVMSGRTVWHLPRNGIKGAGPNPLCPPDLAEHTLAAVFNRAGYDTMRTCKKGNSYKAANEQFTVRKEATKRGASPEDGSAWHAEQVLAYLDERATTEDDDPFLIYFGFSHPHDPRWASDELVTKYGAHNTEIPPQANPGSPALPANWLPAHPFHHGHPGLRDEVNVQGVKRRRDEPTIRNETGRQFACDENIDTQIGRVLARLDSMGELENTYVIYTSDHGMAIGRHGLQGKQNLYEHTWRVPLIVKGPGIAAGSRSRGNVYLLDMLGTLCDLAGIATPATFEGASFRPVLLGETTTVRDALFGVYCGGTKPGMRCVRKGDWKLIKYDVMDGEVRETQLFDLSRNPNEFLIDHHDDAVVALTRHRPEKHQVNLAGDSRYADRLVMMEALLLDEMKRLDDPYRLWDQDKD